MNYTKCTVDTNIISQLADSPTQSAAELKACFDQAEGGLKQFINQTLIEELNTEDSALRSLISANATAITQLDNAICNRVYPVGSIYMSMNSTSPATLFGGTWVQLPNKFLLGASSTYAAGTTGGEATHKLTTNEMPSHNHIVGAHSHGLNSHTHTVPAHSHGLNSHTHTYSNSASSTGAASGNTGSTTLTVNQIPSHTHSSDGTWSGVSWTGSGNSNIAYAHSNNSYVSNEWTDKIPVLKYTGGGQGHTHTLNSHTHTITKTSTNTGVASGSTANSSVLTTGAASGSTANNTAFNSGATGGSTAHNNMPPYLAVYMWKRTA